LSVCQMVYWQFFYCQKQVSFTNMICYNGTQGRELG